MGRRVGGMYVAFFLIRLSWEWFNLVLLNMLVSVDKLWVWCAMLVDNDLSVATPRWCPLECRRCRPIQTGDAHSQVISRLSLLLL